MLLIAPRFFGYDETIAGELRRRGATVVLLADRPFASPLYHAAARLAPSLTRQLTERHYARRLVNDRDFDAVLVVNGQTVSPQLIRRLRAENARATFIYYLWDSIANRGSSRRLFPLFDRAYTFEWETAAKYGLRFRPLFFTESAGGQGGEPRYDISFVGTAHTDRHRVIERLDRSLPSTVKRYWFLYLKARWLLTAYRLTNRHFRWSKASTFRYSPLSRAQSHAVFAESRVILDIEHQRQTGLTMRTLEVLGAGKKLATTNSEIRRYALYDPQRIVVVDRKVPIIPSGFFTDAPPPLDATTHNRYSLAGWIDELFAEEDRSACHLAADPKRR